LREAGGNSSNIINMRYAAMLLALLWAVWWVSWGFLSVMLLPGLAASGIAVRVIPGILFLLATFSAWKSEYLCGLALVVVGLLVLVGFPAWAPRWYPSDATVFVMAVGGLPPLLAGALFMEVRRRRIRAELEEFED